MYAFNPSYRFVIALNTPDLMKDISVYDQNEYVHTRDGIKKATDDINIFNKAAIKAC